MNFTSSFPPASSKHRYTPAELSHYHEFGGFHSPCFTLGSFLLFFDFTWKNTKSPKFQGTWKGGLD